MNKTNAKAAFINSIDVLRARNADPASIAKIECMIGMIPDGKSGTMASWFQSHHGRIVETYQLGFGGRPWLPGPRMINASVAKGRVVMTDPETATASGPSVSGSSRNYAGMRVLASNDRCIVVEGDDVTIIYTIDETADLPHTGTGNRS